MNGLTELGASLIASYGVYIFIFPEVFSNFSLRPFLNHLGRKSLQRILLPFHRTRPQCYFIWFQKFLQDFSLFSEKKLRLAKKRLIEKTIEFSTHSRQHLLLMCAENNLNLEIVQIPSSTVQLASKRRQKIWARCARAQDKSDLLFLSISNVSKRWLVFPVFELELEEVWNFYLAEVSLTE